IRRRKRSENRTIVPTLSAGLRPIAPLLLYDLGQGSTDGVVSQVLSSVILDIIATRHYLGWWCQIRYHQPEGNCPMNEEAPLTLSVPEAGRKYFGLSRNGSYNAAAKGDLPTVRIGKLVRVPVRLLEAMLDNAGTKSAS